jgi:hypothetical protein
LIDSPKHVHGISASQLYLASRKHRLVPVTERVE